MNASVPTTYREQLDMYSQKQVDRFWSNVQMGGTDQCWPWKRSRHQGGYGQVALLVDGVNRVHKAHKVAWEIGNNKRLPMWQRVKHSCNNHLCCNPHHVVLSAEESPGKTVTQVRGESHGQAKLTENQARLIKYRLNLLTTRDIADAFSVSYHAVWDIRHNITWKHI